MSHFNPKVLYQFVRSFQAQTLLDAMQYSRSVRARNRRFALKKARGRFTSLGKVISIDKRTQGAVIHCENGHIELHFLSAEILRVRVRQDGEFRPPFSYAVERIDFPTPTVLDGEDKQTFNVRTDQLVCRVMKDSSALRFEMPDGRVISEDDGGAAWRERDVRWTRKLPPDEACYGLGERAHALNLRGKRWELWNTDPMPYQRGADPLYASIPFYLGVRADVAHGVLWDNPARGYVDLGAEKPDRMTFGAEDNELRFYLFAGPTPQNVLKNYTALTGHMPLPPMWALGYHQSRWGYETEDDFRKLVQEFRQRRLPCDVLYFDIDYMDGYRCFTWDRKRFAKMPTLLADLARHGFKSVAILDPGIKVDPHYPIDEEGQREDVFLKYPDGTRVVAPVWPGKCHFPDFTSAQVRAWWAGHVMTLAQAGFAGFWNDMNEPALIARKSDKTLADYVQHEWEGEGKTHVAGGHNVYGMLMARATREGLQKHRPDKRVFTLTRAAHAGAQRYTSSWTGDNVSTWDHLRLSISMALNMGLSGLSFTGPDIGGFAGSADGELLTRWMQLGCMLPYFRSHTMKGTPHQEPWSFGEKYEQIIRCALEMRYQFLPYIYSVFVQCAQDGTPIIRPLFWVDPEDKDLYSLDDEFMLGDSVLVAPVLDQGADQRRVYLPHGVWYEYGTGKLIDGAQYITAQAPLDTLPLYIRAGHTLPMWPLMQFVGERSLDESRLRVYAGSGDTSVYEDAGEGLDYQKGDFRWSYFNCRFLPNGQFAIQWRRAGKYEPPYQQIRVEVVGIPSEPEMVEIDGQAAPIWYFENGVVEFLTKSFSEARITGRSHRSEKAQQTMLRPPKK